MAGSWLDGGGGGKAVDVVGIVDAKACNGLMQIVEYGALLSMGTTSDGGALGITVTIDGEWRREYVRNADELMAYLAEAVPAVEELMGASRPSAVGQKRPRRRATR